MPIKARWYLAVLAVGLAALSYSYLPALLDNIAEVRSKFYFDDFFAEEQSMGEIRSVIVVGVCNVFSIPSSPNFSPCSIKFSHLTHLSARDIYGYN
jgi:hypothetical protein